MMHHQSTMKIGTDAILLAAWVDLNKVESVLDVGTGSGIIAMIMAQRDVPFVEAIEIDEKSAQEAQLNFNTSQWKERFRLHHQDAREFGSRCKSPFDLIICNPPFFYRAYHGNHERRNLARHAGNFTFNDLFCIALNCLKPDGSLAVVIPASEWDRLKKAADDTGFFLHQKMNIIPVEGRKVNRLNLLFKQTIPPQIDETFFVIRGQDGSFSAAYYSLLKDYYLGF
ncbi:MAG: methyltransferase [Bacteroidales bacterium]|nr:methyltransferase [Bacteroidales bacterium]HOI31774.1 methyltransferase [Bacteroidales bacterium]